MSTRNRPLQLAVTVLGSLLASTALLSRPAAADGKLPLEALVQRWDKAVLDRLGRDGRLKRLAAKYPLVLLHSRHLYAGGDYKQSAYSFSYKTANERIHHNQVEILFHNGGEPKTFSINMVGGQQNLVVDLGPADFEKDPRPARISIDDPRVASSGATAVEGHVYLERIRDSRGNNFYVVFQVIAVDPGSRYMAFLWRRLPGGNVVRPWPNPPVS
jgi:hypothetical protein